MTTSPTTSVLRKPTGVAKVPSPVFAYLQTRNRLHAFNRVQREFEKSGISKADLAKRMGKGADRISHLLGAPGNWTLDTVSDLLFALTGAELTYAVTYPTEKPARNATKPDWFLDDTSLDARAQQPPPRATTSSEIKFSYEVV